MPTLVDFHDADEYYDDEDVDKENMDEQAVRPAKRLAVGSSADEKKRWLADFPVGAVTRVKLSNFMTYNDAEFEPGPRLNLVLGPNGTGKSSLVCALCLGLAGGSKLLGRGDNVKEYIQRGKNKAFVEVSLSKGDGTELVIRRDMEKVKHDDKTSVVNTWKINGRGNQRQKDVEAKMAELNIQLDNLCQFLPQDKVVEFARLTPSELLAETQKAIGDSALYNMHQDLIAKNKELVEEQGSKAGRDAQLEKLQREQERQGPEYERFKKKQSAQDRIALLEKKTIAIELEERLNAYDESAKEYSAAKEEMRKHTAESKKDEAPYKALQDKAKKYKADAQRLVETLKALKGDTNRAENDAAQLDQDIERLNEELNQLSSQSQERKERINRLKQQVADLQRELEALPRGQTQIEAQQLHQLKQQLAQAQKQAGDAEAEKDERAFAIRTCEEAIDRMRGQLERLNNIHQHRLQSLERRHRGIANAYKWVKENSREFSAQVFGPIAVEVQVQDQQHARYVESQVPNWVWAAFITTNREDEGKLSQALRGMCERVPVICYTGADWNTPITHQAGEPEQFARYDIRTTLDQVIEAPGVVKKAMEEHSGLSYCYVGTLNTKQHFESLQREGVPTVYTPADKVSFGKSKYNSASLNSKYDNIKSGLDFLVGNVQQAQVDAINGQLEHLVQDRQRLVTEAQDLQQQADQYREQAFVITETYNQVGTALRQREAKYKAVSSKVAALKRQLETAEFSAEPMDREPEIRQDMSTKADLLHKKVKKIVADVGKRWERIQKLAVLELNQRECEMMEAAMKERNKEQEARGKQLRDREKELERKLRIEKDSLDALKAKAERKGVLDPAIQHLLDAIPDDLDTIQAEIEAKRAEIENMVVNDNSVAERYEARAKQIAVLAKELEQQEQTVKEMEEKIEEVKGVWLPKLEEMTAKINETFSRNFEEMGCAGEVALKKHEDFEKWAMEIRVKFREGEELQVLTAQRQSGGERSVSTILYLIALQDVTVTPFRVVDEINQGMDPQNERKVYQQLVEASTLPGTPQCFLLTPKLLPDLPYNENITILEIFNGREIDKAIKEHSMDELMFGTRHL